MKKLFILLFASSLLLISSCSKDFLQVNAIVEKNCTGSYLKINDKFYYVCNKEKLDSYTQGQSINVQYKVLEGCKSKEETNACTMAFNYEAIVEIKEIINK